MKVFRNNPNGAYRLDAGRVLSELGKLGSATMRRLQAACGIDPQSAKDDREKWRLVALLASLEHDGKVASGLVAGTREFAHY